MYHKQEMFKYSTKSTWNIKRNLAYMIIKIENN